MKLRNIYIAAATMLLLGACSDDKDYAPGDADAPDCMGIYFDTDNQTDFIFAPEDDANITITLHRQNTAVAADVPLVCSCTSQGVTFPASAHFDAGSADASVVINCSGLPLKTMSHIVVTVPDSYINHYAATLFNYESSVLVSQWEPANVDGSPVTVYFTTTDYNPYNTRNTIASAVFKPIECEMEVLPGARRVRLHRFIGSDADITLEFSPSPYESYSDYYRVLPLDHFVTMNEVYESDAYGDEWYNPWYLAIDSADDEDSLDYAKCNLTTLEGQEITVDYPRFYSWSDSFTFEYSYANLRTGTSGYNSVSMGFTGTPSGDVTLPDYFYVFFRWNGESGL